jgi:hypothetical protein
MGKEKLTARATPGQRGAADSYGSRMGEEQLTARAPGWRVAADS